MRIWTRKPMNRGQIIVLKKISICLKIIRSKFEFSPLWCYGQRLGHVIKTVVFFSEKPLKCARAALDSVDIRRESGIF